MGCGASSSRTAIADSDVVQTGAIAEHSADELVAPVAKRMESKYPWEDGEKVPEDTTVVFVLGGPGSGKSTQCQKLVQQYGYTHLVTGDLLRAEVDSGTAIGKWAENLMQKGKLVPNQLSITLLKRAMTSATNPLILVDGFPRSIDQIGLFEKGICKCHAVIFFDVTADVAKARRVKAGENGYALLQLYETFEQQSVPVKQHYTEQNKCHVIDASRSPDVIFKDVEIILQGLEARRRKELEDLQEADRRAAEEEGGEQSNEEEEEDASYAFTPPAHVPADYYNKERTSASSLEQAGVAANEDTMLEDTKVLDEGQNVAASDPEDDEGGEGGLEVYEGGEADKGPRNKSVFGASGEDL